VYGACEIDGEVGIWMEFVRGKTLEHLVRDGGRMSAEEACVVGETLCRALAAVHQKGLLHRDVKASNVMRDADGRIVLLDFGTGTEIVRDGGEFAERVTGTPRYMAPELFGTAAASVQSDIYGLGVLLFYLVSGSYPVSGDSLAALRRAHTTGTRALLSDLRPDLPDAFLRVIERATAPHPGARYVTAGAMQSALSNVFSTEAPPSLSVPSVAVDPHGTSGDVRPPVPSPRRWPPAERLAQMPARRRRLAAVVAGMLAALILSFGVERRTSSPPSSGARQSIAVLPFRALGPAQEMRDFSEGMSDDITAQISRLPGLRVIAGASVRQFADQERTTVDGIGKSLRVDTVVTGSVRVSGDNVRVVAQMFDTRSSSQLWAETFDGTVDDVFTLQADVARRIAGALRGQLSAQDATLLTEQPAMRRDVYSLYVKARGHLYKRTADGASQAITALQRAVELDPVAAPLRAALAEAYQIAGTLDVIATQEAFSKAEAEALEAIRLDSQLPEAHALLGLSRHLQLGWREAGVAYETALGLNPSYAAAHHWRALWLAEQARFIEALREIDRARDLDPLSVGISMARGLILGLAGDHAEAIQQFQSLLEIDPAYSRGYSSVSEVYADMGDWTRAFEALDRAEQLAPDRTDLQAQRAYLYAASGQSDKARTILRALKDPAERKVTSAYELSTIYAALGDKTTALVELERARRDQDDLLVFARVDPKLARLRGDPGFTAFLRSIGLDGESKES
jgi:TolB-like protein/tetratricopeptide (TPR) repeat protein